MKNSLRNKKILTGLPAIAVYAIIVLATAGLFYYLGYHQGYFASSSKFYDGETAAIKDSPDQQLGTYFQTRQYLYGRWAEKNDPSRTIAIRVNRTIDEYIDTKITEHYDWSLVKREENPQAFYLLKTKSTGSYQRYFLVQKVDITTLLLQDRITGQIIEYTRQ